MATAPRKKGLRGPLPRPKPTAHFLTSALGGHCTCAHTEDSTLRDRTERPGCVHATVLPSGGRGAMPGVQAPRSPRKPLGPSLTCRLPESPSQTRGPRRGRAEPGDKRHVLKRSQRPRDLRTRAWPLRPTFRHQSAGGPAATAAGSEAGLPLSCKRTREENHGLKEARGGNVGENLNGAN